MNLLLCEADTTDVARREKRRTVRMAVIGTVDGGVGSAASETARR
jgi:hypothetical protein